MGVLRLLVTFILVLCAVAAGGLFSLQNTQTVPLDLLFVQLGPRTISLWLLLSLLIGVVMGILGASGLLLAQRARLSRLTRQKAQLTRELDSLRRVGITEGE
ncbi:conserved hypothetical protein [Luminiphilus syltensis NOR5-1B]|uniref:Lipopolysaccharide assembly protein A domain-containing protein n=1 Tax=Luminiphilus syltensis NOR5-1B TaxID=565045 RepID=B8KX33_9GAMM|nr:LapA family protein [Luminiphilus syltensis]EED34203.1 conserved hypothetical protein [Luminiphilus syltensis NOR5-1B]